MALPTINDVQLVEPILTNMLIAYRQSADRFVASRVFPAVPVGSDSGTYPKLTKKYWFTDGLLPRAPGDPFARMEYGVESGTYKTLQYAGDHAIADEVRANSQIPMELERVGVELLGQKSMLRKEIQWAADFMKTTVWGTDNTSATDWDDYNSGDPVGDLLLASETISNNTGYSPNTLVVGHIVHRALMNHPDILDRIKYVMAAGQDNIQRALLGVLGIDNYLVARGTYANINESAAFAATPIIDDDALLCYVNPSAGLFDATAGKTFVWGPGGGEGTIYRYRENSRHADVLQHKEQWDQAVTASDLGYFFSDIV